MHFISIVGLVRYVFAFVINYAHCIKFFQSLLILEIFRLQLFKICQLFLESWYDLLFLYIWLSELLYNYFSLVFLHLFSLSLAWTTKELAESSVILYATLYISSYSKRYQMFWTISRTLELHLFLVFFFQSVSYHFLWPLSW